MRALSHAVEGASVDEESRSAAALQLRVHRQLRRRHAPAFEMGADAQRHEETGAAVCDPQNVGARAKGAEEKAFDVVTVQPGRRSRARSRARPAPIRR